MQILNIKTIEGCLEGTNVKDIIWSEPISREFLSYLASLGKIILNEGSGKPFYKIIVRGQYSIKGVVGANSSRIILPSEHNSDLLNNLIKYAESYRPSHQE